MVLEWVIFVQWLYLFHMFEVLKIKCGGRVFEWFGLTSRQSSITIRASQGLSTDLRKVNATMGKS